MLNLCGTRSPLVSAGAPHLAVKRATVLVIGKRSIAAASTGGVLGGRNRDPMQSREFSPFLQVLNERDLSIHWRGFALRAIDSAINGARQNVGRFTDLDVPAVLTPEQALPQRACCRRSSWCQFIMGAGRLLRDRSSNRPPKAGSGIGQIRG